MTREGEIDLKKLLKNMSPRLNSGEYIFCSMENLNQLPPDDIIMSFREKEGVSLVIKRECADRFNLEYSFVAAWITLGVHSSLAAVGLTSAVSNALTGEGISCNMVAGFFHDHVFVESRESGKAMDVLKSLMGSK